MQTESQQPSLFGFQPAAVSQTKTIRANPPEPIIQGQGLSWDEANNLARQTMGSIINEHPDRRLGESSFTVQTDPQHVDALETAHARDAATEFRQSVADSLIEIYAGNIKTCGYWQELINDKGADYGFKQLRRNISDFILNVDDPTDAFNGNNGKAYNLYIDEVTEKVFNAIQRIPNPAEVLRQLAARATSPVKSVTKLPKSEFMGKPNTPLSGRSAARYRVLFRDQKYGQTVDALNRNHATERAYREREAAEGAISPAYAAARAQGPSAFPESR
jgi:hypothetical protein